MSMFSIFIIFQSLFLFVQINADPTVHPKPNVSHIDVNSTVFRVVLKEFEKDSNNAGDNNANSVIVIGARNKLLRVNGSSFEIIDEFINGPRTDSFNCAPHNGSTCSDAEERDNDNRVVFIHNVLPRGKIVACGTVYQGMCSIHQLNKLESNGWIGAPNYRNNYVASRNATIFLPTYFKDSNNLTSVSYVVGHDYDGRPDDFSQPALSIRQIKIDNVSFDYLDTNISQPSAIEIARNLKKSYRINFIYAFHYGDFYYVISNQQKTANSSEMEGRIARLCVNDKTMTTYTELPLKCPMAKDQSEESQFNMVTAAHKSSKPPGITDSPDSTFLLLAFAPLNTSNGSEVNSSALLCQRSLADLEKRFNEATKDCMNGGSEATLHPAFTSVLSNSNGSDGAERTCLKVVTNDTNLCAPRANNSYILSKAPYTLEPYLLIKNVRITSLTSSWTWKGERVIAIVGTNKGEIMKVLLNEKRQHLDRRVILSRLNFSLSADEQVQADPAVDDNRQYAYFALSKRVIRYPLQSCSLYTRCHECAKSTLDPLECGWCGDRCASPKECTSLNSTTSKTCPPIIYDFFPKAGPVSGGTNITITGDNFGENATLTSVIIGHDTSCSVVSIENDQIICTTNSSSNSTSGQLTVQVSEHEHEPLKYTIGGTHESQSVYQFLVPTISDISPTFGPMSHGTLIHIKGQNLGIGSKRSIEILNSDQQVIGKCKNITQKDESEMQCEMTHEIKETSEGNITVMIDDAEIPIPFKRYLIKQDPIIESFSPKGSLVESNLLFTIEGQNLDSIAHPYLESSDYKVECDRPQPQEESLTSIKCKLKPFKVKPDSYVTLSLTNGGMPLGLKDANLTIHPDPTLQYAGTIYTDDAILTIIGADLNSDYPIDIKVSQESKESEGTVHTWQCDDVRIIDSRTLKCKVLFDGNETVGESVKVEYKIGDVGNSLNEPEIMNRSNYTIFIAMAGSIAFAMLLSAVVCSIYWYRRSRDATEKPDWNVRYTAIPQPENDYGISNRRPDSTSPYQIDAETIALLEASGKIIATEYVRLGEEIGKGHFGMVRMGSLTSPEGKMIDVAIKTLKHSENDQLNSFMKEAAAMKDFDHPNVMKLIGVCFSQELNEPSLVLPFMKNRDLLQYVRNEEYSPTVRALLKFSLDIARGMEYLSDQKYVHRDLAARNCMLDEHLNVCVADFGLTRDVYEKNYYRPQENAPMPYKWMAIESFRGVFTVKSDIWSYGVTSWEIITRGLVPYPGFGNHQILDFLLHGNRLEKPPYCPENIWQLWRDCWQSDPENRPSFSFIVSEIEIFLAKASARVKLDEVISTDAHAYYYNLPKNTKYYNKTPDLPIQQQAN